MTKSKSKAALFKERVAHLLSERAALKPLLAAYHPFARWKIFSDERSILENKIADLARAGLDLSEEDLRRIPSSRDLSEICLRLVPKYQYLLSFGWSPQGENPVETAYKQRLLALCDPLDNTLERMLDE